MSDTPAAQLIAALTRRRASGQVVDPAAAAAAATERVRAWGVVRVVLADDPVLEGLGIGDALRAAGVEVIVWPTGEGPRELLGLEGPEATCGISVPVAGVAERGTLVLAAGPGQGRALDAAAAYHLAVLPAPRVRMTLAEVLGDVYSSGSPPSALSLVSAPSRTSDIEKISTLGAHGALGLHALVVDPGD